MIAAAKASFPVWMMCRVLKVSPSGYYAWQQREQSPHEHVDEALRAQIVEIHEASRGTHGSPRIHRDLSERGHRTSRKRAARLIRESAIVVRVRRRFVRTTDSNHPHPIAPNRLERDFTVAAPDQCGVGDITYLWTGEGWLYLAVWLDLLSRRIVGWSMADHLRSELALGALEVAIGHRNSSEGVVHHTDRGSQYASDEYRA